MWKQCLECLPQHNKCTYYFYIIRKYTVYCMYYDSNLNITSINCIETLSHVKSNPFVLGECRDLSAGAYKLACQSGWKQLSLCCPPSQWCGCERCSHLHWADGSPKPSDVPGLWDLMAPGNIVVIRHKCHTKLRRIGWCDLLTFIFMVALSEMRKKCRWNLHKHPDFWIKTWIYCDI